MDTSNMRAGAQSRLISLAFTSTKSSTNSRDHTLTPEYAGRPGWSLWLS